MVPDKPERSKRRREEERLGLNSEEFWVELGVRLLFVYDVFAVMKKRHKELHPRWQAENEDSAFRTSLV